MSRHRIELIGYVVAMVLVSLAISGWRAPWHQSTFEQRWPR